MLRQSVDEEDLRNEIINLRKHIARVCSENHILKVKIRKLQDEMIKRDKYLDEFLQSKKHFGFPRTLQDKGISLLLNLKLKNDKQEQLLLEKDLIIKRLQNTLQTAKLYNASSLTKKVCSKGVECSLMNDSKLEMHKKGKLNTKIELHMPNFNYEENEENLEEFNVNSVESQIFLDINFDLKQRTKPFYPDKYGMRSAPDYVKSRECKSNASFEQRAPWENPADGDGINSFGQNQFEDTSLLNPTFRKILKTVEEIMAQRTPIKTHSTDECIQFPAITITDVENGGNANKELVPRSPSRMGRFRCCDEIDILGNELPPTLVTEIHDMHNEDEDDSKEKCDEKKIEPHEEIKQLHVFLMDMITQVDSLKDTISHLRADQEKTDNELKSKDASIGELAKEIEQLKEKRPAQQHHPIEIGHGDAIDDIDLEYENIQKSTEENIKKIAGKLKQLKESKSKPTLSNQCSENKKSLKARTDKHKLDKFGKKFDKKVQPRNKSESRKLIGVGGGDNVVNLPFYRSGIIQASSSISRKPFSRNEFEELD